METQGMSMCDLLERVDLINVIADLDDDVVGKEKDSANGNNTHEVANQDTSVYLYGGDPSSAYLGLRFWEEPLTSAEADDTDLSENCDIDLQALLQESRKLLEQTDLPEETHSKSTSVSRNAEKPTSSSFLYTESKRARAQRFRDEAAARLRRLERGDGFDREDILLASLPNGHFDPRRRKFRPEELRPQPIVRKREKRLVSADEKDSSYWNRRAKNNVSAQRSRAARRLRENQLALRTAFLEAQNAQLKERLRAANAEVDELKAIVQDLKGKSYSLHVNNTFSN